MILYTRMQECPPLRTLDVDEEELQSEWYIQSVHIVESGVEDDIMDMPDVPEAPTVESHFPPHVPEHHHDFPGQYQQGVPHGEAYLTREEASRMFNDFLAPLRADISSMRLDMTSWDKRMTGMEQHLNSLQSSFDDLQSRVEASFQPPDGEEVITQII